MGNSLQDQFLKMGLVDKKKHNQVKKEKHTQKTSGKPERNDIADMAKQALEEKRKRDRQLNKKKIAQREAKEATARARQLIETHKIHSEPGELTYNFKDENTVKKLSLTSKGVDSLTKGKVGIVKLAGEYQLVPADIIYKIRELNPKLVVLLNTTSSKKEKDADDPYAEYEVPDDLMW
jgi:uncharacterized protein YaiL (DUF2058 family)